MRSLLVALDDTAAGAAAIEFALSLSARHGAAATGASLVDIGYLPPLALAPVPASGAFYKLMADVERLKHAHQRNATLHGAFLERCRSRDVRGDILALEGSPVMEVRGAAAAHDLIVIGCDSDFHGGPGGGLTRTVQKILKENPRPLIITPQSVRDPSRIVVAYDGSIPAARTLQIFTLLGLAAGSELHVVSVNVEHEAADRCARQASAYLGLYDNACTIHSIASAANPAECLIAETKALGADLLMMGAYGHRGWREALLGSFTTYLLSQCPTALFIHH